MFAGIDRQLRIPIKKVVLNVRPQLLSMSLSLKRFGAVAVNKINVTMNKNYLYDAFTTCGMLFFITRVSSLYHAFIRIMMAKRTVYKYAQMNNCS